MKCGIDPGRYKIGFALASEEGLLFSAVIPKTAEGEMRRALAEGDWLLLARWCREGSAEKLWGRTLEQIYVGDGTSSAEMVSLLADAPKVSLVDERGSTLEGRARYWRLHPPRGLWRLVPVSLRIPPRDIDDLAAWSLIDKTKRPPEGPGTRG